MLLQSPPKLKKMNKNIYIESFHFVFLLIGYGLGILEYGNKNGWLIIGIMSFIIIAYLVSTVKIEKKKKG